MIKNSVKSLYYKLYFFVHTCISNTLGLVILSYRPFSFLNTVVNVTSVTLHNSVHNLYYTDLYLYKPILKERLIKQAKFQIYVSSNMYLMTIKVLKRHFHACQIYNFQKLATTNPFLVCRVHAQFCKQYGLHCMTSIPAEEQRNSIQIFCDMFIAPLHIKSQSI